MPISSLRRSIILDRMRDTWAARVQRRQRKERRNAACKTDPAAADGARVKCKKESGAVPEVTVKPWRESAWVRPRSGTSAVESGFDGNHSWPAGRVWHAGRHNKGQTLELFWDDLP